MSAIDSPTAFYDHLVASGVEMFAGVPDSLLQDLCACIYDRTPSEANIIAANEGNAVGIACGYHIARGQVRRRLPAELRPRQHREPGAFAGASGRLQRADAADHRLARRAWRRGRAAARRAGPYDPRDARRDGGATTRSSTPSDWQHQIGSALTTRRTNAPVALLVRKGAFSKYRFSLQDKPGLTLTREDALEAVLDSDRPGGVHRVDDWKDVARGVRAARESAATATRRDFLSVGGMGHSSSIAMGACLGTEELVYCIDGDGGFLMHMGSAPVIAQRARDNYRYILINNGAHESVGGQPTVAFDIDIPAILKGSGFEHVELVTDGSDIADAVARVAARPRSALVIETVQGSRPDLGSSHHLPVGQQGRHDEGVRRDSSLRALIFNSGVGKPHGRLHAGQPQVDGSALQWRDHLRTPAAAPRGGRHHRVRGHNGSARRAARGVAAEFPTLRVSFVANEVYDKTNYIYSMHLARELLDDDVLMLHGDLVFNRAALGGILVGLAPKPGCRERGPSAA